MHPDLSLELAKLQTALQVLYALEPAPDIRDFVQQPECQEYEAVLVRQPTEDTLELQVQLPAHLQERASWTDDDQLGLVEGVSHFLYLSERARRELPTTQLELELQAEVDKFALIVERLGDSPPRVLWDLHEWLFERVRYLDSAETERGERYRLANQLAARFCSKFVRDVDSADRYALLRRFYRRGQCEKLELVRAA